MEFTNTFANTCKENGWFIAKSDGNSVDFDKAEQYWREECTVTNYEDWTYSQYITHMATVCENHSWVIFQTYPETTFKLPELIDYFVEISTYGFAQFDESDNDDESDDESDDENDNESDILSNIENDNESEHGISAFASFDEIWEQHFGSNIENAENAEITSEDWDNVRRQLDFDEEEE